MKKFLLLLILIPPVSFSQIQYNPDSSFVFQEVYEVPFSKQEIKTKANEWIALNFNNSNNVIRLNTEDKIILKGNLGKPDIDFDLITEFKDGRYKLIINNISKLERPLDFYQIVKDGKLISFDEYLKFMEDRLKETGIKEKYIKKTLEKKNMDASYLMAKEQYKLIRIKEESLRVQIIEIGKSLFNYFQTDLKSTDDW